MKFIKILKANEVPNRVLELLQESYQENCKPLAYLSTRGGKTEIVISKDKFGINITTYINGKSQSNDNGITDLASHWNKYYSNSTNKEFGQSLYKLIWSDPLLDTTIFTEMKKESAIAQPNKPKPTTTLPDNMEWAWDPSAANWVAVMKDNKVTTPPLYDPQNQNLVNQNTTSYMSTVKSSCLSKFLDGPQYSKEIKIEAGLIKKGLLKYAGFDFNRGTKYVITTKGLEVLRKASEAEHNEVLNEREKLAYLFGFNTDEVSTLDTTGKVIKQSARKWTICEADGTELGEVEADSELDAKIKFGIEHPEYADSQSINAKEIDAKYEETTEQHLDYPNPSETPTTDVILENHTGWVNTASFEDDIRKQFQQPHQKLPNSDRDLALLEEQILQITNEDARDAVRKIFDEFQFSNKEAAEKRPYTEEEKRMLPLFRLLNQHVAKKQIQLEEDPQKDGNIVATGQAEVINDLEHEVKDLGFHCEPIAEITDNDYIGYDIYSLRIFTK